jgi:tRNA threonylcarbamoyladenosine biosynthesis protein TsaB
MTEKNFSILAFDSSSSCCSAALIAAGVLIGEDMRSGPGNSSALLLSMIDRLLQDAALSADELDCIAVAQGPGSFTGLRVSISTAQGLGFSLNKPLVGISTLEILAAQNMPCDGAVCPMLDARRGQVYTGLFDQGPDGETRARSEECVICPEQWAASLQDPVLLCGSGAQLYQDTIARVCTADYRFAPDMNSRPRAAMLARMALKRCAAGRTLAPAQVLPGYVRRPDAERTADQLLLQKT